MFRYFIPFTKLDIFIGLLAATASAFFTGTFFPSILLGCLATFSASIVRDYFSYDRVKTTLSLLYDSMKEKIFGKQEARTPNYRAMPRSNPYEKRMDEINLSSPIESCNAEVSVGISDEMDRFKLR